ncbi:hypothetical protein ACA910_016949 [Epithemia clementina (nom. ined.)]
MSADNNRARLLRSNNDFKFQSDIKPRSKTPRHFLLSRRLTLNVSRSINPSASNGDSKMKNIRQFASKNFFLLGMFVAVTLARLFPSLGNNGGILRPELFIGKYGVAFVFLLSGLSLELSQLAAAASNFKLNFLTQLMTFAAWPYLIGLPLKALFSTALLSGAFPDALLDGLLILTCLPTTVNMCVILTSSANGNTAAALSNAILSNLGGIFLTPALLFRFFGASIHLPFFDMLLKLCSKVLLPVAIGQALRATPVKELHKRHSTLCKRMQEVVLLSILWNAFCTAICNALDVELRHGLLLLLVLTSTHSLALGVLLKFFSLPMLKFSRGDAVAAMFCASQKTLAFGLPLINTVFEGNPNVALYCAPLMLVHPLQLMVGSALVPLLEKYIKDEKQP